MSKQGSLLRVTLAYVVAVAAGAAYLAWGPDVRGWVDALIADLVATAVIFVFSRIYRNSSFYDAYWSVIPPLLVASWWSVGDGNDARTALALAVMLVWAVRLTGNWVYSFPGLHHEDWRYPLLRDRAGGRAAAVVVDLVAIHVIPTLQVFLATVPLYLVATRDRGLNALDAVAVIVGLGAVALEASADVQMHRFVRTKKPGEVMDRGLWAWSRHPNYLGELGFWVAMALFGLAAAPGEAWWLFAGAVAMLAMFLGASIPMMEQRSLERRPDYQRVIDTVPRFVPRLPRGERSATA